MDEQSRFGHLELESQEGVETRGERSFDADEYCRRAEELELHGDFDGALRLYARALGQVAHLESAWVGQLRCLLALDDAGEAVTWSEKAREYLPRSPRVAAWSAVALAQAGRAAEALAMSDASLKLGNIPQIWLGRAWTHDRHRPEPADRCIAKALAGSTNDPVLLLEVSRYYIHRQRWSEASRRLQQVTAARPALARPWYLLGLCHQKLGLRDEALAAFRAAVERAPTHREYRHAMHAAEGANPWRMLWRRLRGR